jgi:hypothetical protein
MSEQKAKELAQSLRSIIPQPTYLAIQEAAAELDRLAELCKSYEEDITRLANLWRVDNEWKAAVAHAADLVDQRGKLRDALAEAQVRIGNQARQIADCGSTIKDMARQRESLREQVRDIDKDRYAARQELATLREDRDALAEGVRVMRRWIDLSGKVDPRPVFMDANDALRAWERKHGHRADAGKEPARKSDEVERTVVAVVAGGIRGTVVKGEEKPQTVVITNNTTVPVNATLTVQVSDPMPVTVKVEEKPPLLDLRRLPVGTVCEAVEDIKIPNTRRWIKAGTRMTVGESRTEMSPDWIKGERVEVGAESEACRWWVMDMQPARVISAPKPTPQPEPFRAGLPALALRRVDVLWDVRSGDNKHDDIAFTADGTRWAPGNRAEAEQHRFRTDRGYWSTGERALDTFEFRPHGATWAEVELKAARLLGKENQGTCSCENCRTAPCLRSELGITDPTRDMTALWAAFREGQQS